MFQRVLLHLVGRASVARQLRLGTLELLREIGRFELIEWWQPDASGTRLELREACSAPHLPERATAAARGLRLGPGEGLAGSAWRRGFSAIARAAVGRADARRSAELQQLGLEAAITVPLFETNETVAVIVGFAQSPQAQWTDLLAELECGAAPLLAALSRLGEAEAQTPSVSNDGLMLVVDAEKRVINTVPDGSRLAGRSAHELIGQPLRAVADHERSTLLHLHPAGLPRTLLYLEAQSETAAPRGLIERVGFLADAAEEIYLIARMDGHIVYANWAASRFLGYTRDDLLRTQLQQLDPSWKIDSAPSHGDGPLARRPSSRTQIGSPYPTCLRSAHDWWLPVDASVSLLADEHNEEYVLFVAHDRREQQQREGRLQAELRLNATLRRLAMAFAAELDHDRLLQLVISEATAVTGSEHGAFFARDNRGNFELRAAAQLHGRPDDDSPLAGAAGHFDKVESGCPLVYRGPQLHDRTCRAIGRAAYLTAPIHGPGGTTLGGLLLAHRDAEHFTPEHERIVSGLATHAAVALNNARLHRQLQASARHRDEFLAMLGHELRNPLGPIITATELMGMPDAASKLPRLREVIERQARHLRRLVDDLMDVSRLARGKVVLDMTTIELSTVIEAAVEMAEPLIDEHRHRLHLAVAERGLPVRGDAARLIQVFTNLLTNAAKYTPPGGEIWIQARRDAGQVLAEVRDSGRGIKPEMLPHIFNMFSQGRRGIDRSEGGLGLGLTLVRSFVELHGGTIQAFSRGPNQGSTFAVRLPICSVTSVAKWSTKAARSRNGAGSRTADTRRVLVVDDNDDARDLLTQALRARGYTVCAARDGPTALQRAETFRPEVAVLDIGLPVMDGYELATRLKERPELSDLQLIALTGYIQPNDRARARAAGFIEHLSKPIEIERLCSAIGDSTGKPVEP